MIALYIAAGLLIILSVIIIFQLKSQTNGQDITYRLNNLSTGLQRIEAAVKDEIATNRKELSDAAAKARIEQANSLSRFKGDFIEVIKDSNQ